jgi:hypothetical protein
MGSVAFHIFTHKKGLDLILVFGSLFLDSCSKDETVLYIRNNTHFKIDRLKVSLNNSGQDKLFRGIEAGKIVEAIFLDYSDDSYRLKIEIVDTVYNFKSIGYLTSRFSLRDTIEVYYNESDTLRYNYMTKIVER